MFDLAARSAFEQAALVRDGQVSARELVDATLAAIERDDPELNAFVLVAADRARAEADAIEPGDARPLAGVPVAIKDLIVLTEGLRTTNASRALGDWVPEVDSAPVARLREAGAIVVGKTNTPEFGGRPVTEPERFGPTRNPWNPELMAGGSSGGSAAAVAAGMLAIAHGSDAGGSIRIPASCCGLVGLKPTRFRVPLGPELASYAAFGSDGVLTRTVIDTALALDVLCQGKADHPAAPPRPPTPFSQAAQFPPARLRIRVCTAPHTGAEVDPECVAAAESAARALVALGHDVDDWTPDWSDDAFEEHWTTGGSGMMQGLIGRLEKLAGFTFDRELMEPETRKFVEIPVTPAGFQAASKWLREYAVRVLRGWQPGSILLTPTMTVLPQPVGSVMPGTGVRFSAFTRPFNVTGQPAISLPLHRTQDGVPVGVQLVGPLGTEARLLSLAGQLEQAAPWPTPAPPRSG